jgi:hypothetical protein
MHQGIEPLGTDSSFVNGAGFNGLVKVAKKDNLCTNHKGRFIDETTTAGRTTPGLAEPCTLMKHKAAGATARGFHHQTLRAMMQTFPDVFKVRKDFLLRDAHA